MVFCNITSETRHITYDKSRYHQLTAAGLPMVEVVPISFCIIGTWIQIFLYSICGLWSWDFLSTNHNTNSVLPYSLSLFFLCFRVQITFLCIRSLLWFYIFVLCFTWCRLVVILLSYYIITLCLSDGYILQKICIDYIKNIVYSIECVNLLLYHRWWQFLWLMILPCRSK